MSKSDQQPEEEATEELLADMPLPSDAKTFFLGGLFVLSMLTAAYAASEIVLPLIFAIMLNLLMQPALRAKGCGCPERWRPSCSSSSCLRRLSDSAPPSPGPPKRG